MESEFADKDVIIMTIDEYLRKYESAEFRFKKVVLDCNFEEYLKLLDAKFEKSDVIKKIRENRNYGFQNFIVMIGKGQIGKSIGMLNLLLYFNRDANFEKYIAYDLNSYLEKSNTMYKKFIAIEEAHRIFRTKTKEEDIEISNILIDYYETSPFLQNSLILTQPSLRMLRVFKSKIDYLFQFIRRGIANVYIPLTNINNTKEYFKFAKERVYFYPIPIEIYKRYEKMSYNSKQDLISIDKQMIKRYSNPYR